MALAAQADYDALNSQPAGQGPASTMESPPSQRTLGECAGYYRELLRFLTAKLRCPHEAADVILEVFARLLALDNPDVIRQPRAFLYRIARNLVLDSPSDRPGNRCTNCSFWQETSAGTKTGSTSGVSRTTATCCPSG